MSNLISKSDFDGIEFKYLTKNMRDVEIESLILEAQQLDVRPVLGAAFYTDLIKNYIPNNPTPDKYNDFIEGAEYLCNDDTIQFDGFKYVVLYYTYARYLLNQDANSTPFGMKTKTNEFSTDLTATSLRMKIDTARNAAQAHWEETCNFLHAKRSDFDLWSGFRRETKKGGAQIKAVGGKTVTPSHMRLNQSKDFNQRR